MGWRVSYISKLRRYRDLSSFLVKRPFVAFPVDEDPYFDGESTPMFLALLGASRFYLEYGSGSSTIAAARMGKRFICVETDKYFLATVRKKIGGLKAGQTLVHADIGLTGPWGAPLRAKSRWAGRLKKWRAYPERAWTLIGVGEPPDLVLVDGRFRVATALTCLAHLAGHPEATVLVDDYIDRPWYHVLEQYADLVEIRGRMAVFHPRAEAPVAAIAEYAADWR